MRVIRKIGFFSLLIVATFLVQNASALIVLPDSTYADIVGNWQGSRTYTEDNFNVLVEFAVYEVGNTTDVLGPGKSWTEQDLVTELVNELGMTGDYIYMYQIFQHVDEGYEDVTYFSILDINGDAIDEALMEGTTALDDGEEGISPAPIISETQGVWVWSFENGYISTGQHSYFLVFSSDSEPVAGNYKIEGPDYVPVPEVPEIPEPGMLALLGLGSAMAFMRRKKFV